MILWVLEGEEPLVAAVQELVLEIVVMGAARSSSWLSSSSEPETEPLPPSQPIVSATYRVRGRARRPRPEAAAYAPAAAYRRRFPGARGARKFTFTAKDGRRRRAGAAEPGAGTEAASRRAGGPAGARSPHTMAFLGSRRQPVSGTSSRLLAPGTTATGATSHTPGRGPGGAAWRATLRVATTQNETRTLRVGWRK